MSAVLAVVLLVAVQRVAELFLSSRNARRLLAAGGIEAGAGHCPLFFVVHGGWLAALALLVSPEAAVVWPWLATFAALQAARIWVIAALGPLWTTRIITVPGAAPVRTGPYRWVRHPNYLIVCAEIATLPLAFDAVAIAAVFSALNLPLIVWRMRIENRALAAVAATLSSPPADFDYVRRSRKGKLRPRPHDEGSSADGLHQA